MLVGANSNIIIAQQDEQHYYVPSWINYQQSTVCTLLRQALCLWAEAMILQQNSGLCNKGWINHIVLRDTASIDNCQNSVRYTAICFYLQNNAQQYLVLQQQKDSTSQPFIPVITNPNSKRDVDRILPFGSYYIGAVFQI